MPPSLSCGPWAQMAEKLMPHQLVQRTHLSATQTRSVEILPSLFLLLYLVVAEGAENSAQPDEPWCTSRQKALGAVRVGLQPVYEMKEGWLPRLFKKVTENSSKHQDL